MRTAEAKSTKIPVFDLHSINFSNLSTSRKFK
ncbi:unnamed protein product [Schistosoma curassoni]|uniref:Uncharacterized protein n=1 Tax=Schistosoma curassoni TaxID=6186 RepID=A0A183L3D8_9TREM|nr:unnamed protein product [Schistosoma curassoni]